MKPNIKIHSKYRSDIDGLRAVAVISVVIFHAFPKYLNSGFIGVDIFFVISGYLISSIIFEKLLQNQFSFIDFYQRRIRRIFPALITILTFCLIFGWFFLISEEYKNLSKHVAGGASFISNYVLWSESGYFDKASHSKPLLHLWSLGIEEQFYIFFPLFLWIVWKLKLNLLFLISILITLSFILNLLNVIDDPVGTFYSPFTRIWELLAGSILAYFKIFYHSLTKKLNFFISFFKKKKNYKYPNAEIITQNILTSFGFLLIFSSYYFIDLESSFPGLIATMPVMGVFLCISAGPLAWFNKYILSNKILVFFGLISFPLYLWHWIVLVLPRLIKGQELSTYANGSLVVLSVILATLTYYFIEKPLRWGGGKVKTIFLIVLMILIGLIGYYIFKNEGFKTREHSIIKEINSGDVGHDIFHLYSKENFYECTPQSIANSALRWKKYKRCYQSKPDSKLDIALIGDSHSEHLFIGLAENLKNYNVVNYIQNALPSVNNENYKDIFQHVISDKNIEIVIISAFWTFRNREVPPQSSLVEELDQTIERLYKAKKKIYIVQDTPSFSFDPYLCKYERKLRKKVLCSENDRGYIRRNKFYMPEFKRLENQKQKFTLLNIEEYFCKSNYCNMNKNNNLLFRDSNHLNINGSKYIGKVLSDLIIVN